MRVAKPGVALLKLYRLGAQHKVRKINVPLMRRYVRALGHETQIAQIAVVNDLPVVFLLDAIDFQGGRFVHQIELGAGNDWHRFT